MSTETPQTLLLDSLEIRNFRCFQHLQIEKLGRVNLIVGENGVGKTALLEALQLYARPDDEGLIKQILRSRDEDNLNMEDYDALPFNIMAFFHGRSFTLGNTIEIGALNVQENKVLLTTSNSSKNKKQFRAVFVSAKGLVMNEMEFFWNKSFLSSKKKEIIIALNIVPTGKMIEDLTFIRFEDNEEHFPVVQITGLENAVSLRSLGEGMVRMFGLALALANVKDGMLLVDEIESGLHYLIQAAMWDMIFKTAAKLNVQVFATTHSWDCVEGFQQAAQENEDIEGMLVRLKRRGDDIVPTLFDERRLAIATREQIEVR